jgi:hypothetical protein
MRRMALFALCLTAACGSDPAVVDLTGTWTGSYTHPTFPGSLELTLTSTDETISGTFAIQYGTGGGGVQNLGGTVTGTRPSPTTVSFDLEHATFTWSFVGQLTSDDLMQGTWQSATSAGLGGEFETERE